MISSATELFSTHSFSHASRCAGFVAGSYQDAFVEISNANAKRLFGYRAFAGISTDWRTHYLDYLFRQTVFAKSAYRLVLLFRLGRRLRRSWRSSSLHSSQTVVPFVATEILAQRTISSKIWESESEANVVRWHLLLCSLKVAVTIIV